MKTNYSTEEREYLEHLSDQVRKGEPIGFNQALLVIEYQSQKKKEAKYKFSIWNKIKKAIGFNKQYE